MATRKDGPASPHPSASLANKGRSCKRCQHYSSSRSGSGTFQDFGLQWGSDYLYPCTATGVGILGDDWEPEHHSGIESRSSQLGKTRQRCWTVSSDRPRIASGTWRSVDISQTPGHLNPTAVNKALLEYKARKSREHSISSIDTFLASNGPYTRSFYKAEDSSNATYDIEAWLRGSPCRGRSSGGGNERPGQRHRSAMRTVSGDDYLLARGANPRTGVVTPACQADSSPLDEAELLRQRGISNPSKWRLKGDQWVSLELGEPTPIPSPPAELKHSLDSRVHRMPPKSAAQCAIRIRDHEDRYIVTPTFPGDYPNPKPMTDRQKAEFEQSVERVKRHSIIVDSPPRSSPRGMTPTEQTMPPSKQKGGDAIARKVIGSPIKSPATLVRDEGRNTSTETVITRPGLSNVNEYRTPSAPGPTHEYYCADDVGNGIPVRPMSGGSPQNAKLQQTQRAFLGLARGDWIEDVAVNILDKSQIPQKPLPDPPMSSFHSHFPPTSQPTHQNVPRPPPRPLMSNAFKPRIMPNSRGMAGREERGPPFQISKSWSQPYQCAHADQPRPVHRPATTVNSPYVLLRQSDPRHQGIFPIPQAGMVKDMRQRMDVTSGEGRIGRSSPEHQLTQNTSRITTTTMDDSLFMPRKRPRGTSRPHLPPRAEGTVSVPQVSPHDGIGSSSVSRSLDSMVANTGQNGHTQHEKRDGAFMPNLPHPPDITITTTSPERTTRQFNERSHRNHRCLHHRHQMSHGQPGPTMCQCDLIPSGGHGHLQGQGQGQSLDGSVLLPGGHRLPEAEPLHGMKTASNGGRNGSNGLQASPIIGTDLSTADPDFLHHVRCCPTCCAMGCHGGCLGHAGPPGKSSRSLDAETIAKEIGFGFGFRNVIKNSLRFRNSFRMPKQQQREPSGAPGVGATGMETGEEEQEITIAELESPLPWEENGPVSLLPVGKSPFSSFWAKAKASSVSATGGVPLPGKRVTSDSSAISNLSVFDITNLNINTLLETLTIPVSMAGAFLKTHPQILLLGNRLAWKLVEMFFQVLSTLKLLSRWWWITRQQSQGPWGRHRKKHHLQPQEMVYLATEVFRSVIYCCVLCAVGVMVGRVLGMVVVVLQGVFWVGRGVVWGVGGFGLFG
ncbi:hypothetical protein MMC28_011494 [Mycoblastus sanguinarius]|nr:hypothetical protein [Mycoblastus sanguinarius]